MAARPPVNPYLRGATTSNPLTDLGHAIGRLVGGNPAKPVNPRLAATRSALGERQTGPPKDASPTTSFTHGGMGGQRAVHLPATSGRTPVPKKTVSAAPVTPKPQASSTPTAATPAAVAPVTPKRGAGTGANAGFYTNPGDVMLGAGQTLGFTKGRGYHAVTPPRATAAATSTTGGKTLTQIAQEAVQAELAPLYAQAKQQAAQQTGAVTGFTRQLMQAEAGLPDAINSDYSQAASQLGNISTAAANSLRAANPNAQEQALLQAVGAPDSQQQQVATQLGNTFNGGAAVSQYLNGVLPVTSLEGARLASAGLARSLPVIEGLRGQQALQTAIYNQAQSRQQIADKAPGLYQTALSSLQGAQAKQEQLNLEAKALGLKTQNQDFTQTLAVTKANAAASKIDAGVSKLVGYVAAADGSPILKGGKLIPVNTKTGKQGAPKLPTALQINNLVSQWHDGKVGSVTVPAVDKNGNPAYDQTGAQKYVTKSVKIGKLPFGQAYKRLVAMGLTDVKARQYLDTAYGRGDDGRAWLTNEEQHALATAGLSGKASVIQGRGVLNAHQTAALQAAGLLPPGQHTAEGYYVIG